MNNHFSNYYLKRHYYHTQIDHQKGKLIHLQEDKPSYDYNVEEGTLEYHWFLVFFNNYQNHIKTGKNYENS